MLRMLRAMALLYVREKTFYRRYHGRVVRFLHVEAGALLRLRAAMEGFPTISEQKAAVTIL